MNFMKANTIRDYFYNFNSLQVFALSFFICISFYTIEGVLGIDRFYHPDSSYYLGHKSLHSFERYLSNPTLLFHQGYYVTSKIFSNNYYLLILLNFVLYSFTNVIIFKIVFKKYFNILNKTKLLLLFYLFFLDPYRLHLASHVLKETILIFIIIVIILSNLKILKLFFVFLLEVFRSNSWIYLLIFINYSKIKLVFKKKIILLTIIISILSLVLFLALSKSAQDLAINFLELIINKIKQFDSNQMPLRTYDNVYQFKNFDFPAGFILKNITWPVMLLSGFFMFFVSSLLFKFLGIIILLNNFIIYIITKKTYINLGLIIILLMISIYTTSYTAMFRYSYIAIYASVIYFFLQFDHKLNNKKKNNKI